MDRHWPGNYTQQERGQLRWPELKGTWLIEFVRGRLSAVAAHVGGWWRASEGDFYHALEALVPKGAFPAGVYMQVLRIIGRDASAGCSRPRPERFG